MSKIIGVTVGTPLSADKIKEKIKPVTSVNGVEADENGNVEVQGGGNGFTPTVKATQTSDGVNLIITNYDEASGGETSTFVSLKNGKDGTNGKAGVKGDSSYVSATETADGVELRITNTIYDSNGSSTVETDVVQINGGGSGGGEAGGSGVTPGECTCVYVGEGEMPEGYHIQINPNGEVTELLPAVTAADDGKFLRVVDGTWAAVVLPNAEGGVF